jgi:hypothetical protein
LRAAIARYREASFDVPNEWIEEAYDLFVELVK